MPVNNKAPDRTIATGHEWTPQLLAEALSGGAERTARTHLAALVRWQRLSSPADRAGAAMRHASAAYRAIYPWHSSAGVSSTTPLVRLTPERADGLDNTQRLRAPPA